MKYYNTYMLHSSAELKANYQLFKEMLDNLLIYKYNEKVNRKVDEIVEK